MSHRYSNPTFKCTMVQKSIQVIRVPEWVIFNKAPVAFLCTLMSLDRARRVSGTRAPDLAILDLFSSIKKNI